MGGRRQYSGPASKSTCPFSSSGRCSRSSRLPFMSSWLKYCVGTTPKQKIQSLPSFIEPHMLHFQRLPPSVKLMNGFT